MTKITHLSTIFVLSLKVWVVDLNKTDWNAQQLMIRERNLVVEDMNVAVLQEICEQGDKNEMHSKKYHYDRAKIVKKCNTNRLWLGLFGGGP